MNQSIALSVVGLVSTCAGVYLLVGAGWSLVLAGVVLFVTGGLMAKREAR